MVRNLSMEAVEKLANELCIDMDSETLWKLTGGNPRALYTVARIGLNRWLKDEMVKTYMVYPKKL